MDDDADITFWHGNICNPVLVNHLVQRADVVVHLAAETHVTRSIFDNQVFVETDVVGTQNLLTAVSRYRHQIERVIHISTSEVYGSAVGHIIDEDHPLLPTSPYAAAKCAADRLAYSYYRTYDLPITIVRPFNNYGPRQHLEKLIPRFITSTFLGEEMLIHGDGSARRDFVHVDDTCRAILNLIDAPLDKVAGEVFNVATGDARSVLEISQDIKALSGDAESEVQYTVDRPGQVALHRGEASKIKDTVGWTPSVQWGQGLSECYEWYRNNRPWWEGQIKMRSIPIALSDGTLARH